MTDAPRSLLHAMAPVILSDPAREAVVFEGDRITYGEIASRSLALARHLRQSGVKAGDRVAVMVTPRPEAIVSMLGVWLAGATWAGINTRYKAVEQEQILCDCEARVMISITSAGTRDLATDLEQHRTGLGIEVLQIGQGLWEGDLPEPAEVASPGDSWNKALDSFEDAVPAVVIYTSGSTGKPKGALISHAGLAWRAHTLATDRFCTDRLRMLIDLPVNHIGALASGIGVVLASGGLMVMREQFDPGFVLEATATEKLHVLSGVPAMLTRLVDHPGFVGADLSSVKFVSWGAGPINERVLQKLLSATTASFTQQYGMTESNGPIVYTPPTRDLEILLHTTGRPDPRLDLRIADDNAVALPAGEEGEVQVRLEYPFMGYLSNLEATREAFTEDGYLRTGDRAKLREDGYLVFCGRSKEMYKSGGFNVYPREIEIALEAHPAIRAAAVIGRDDPKWGQVGHAYVENSGELSPGEIEAWCKARLADFKVPKLITILDSLPRTPVDKVDRQALVLLSNGDG